jgi:hypothetical protein
VQWRTIRVASLVEGHQTRLVLSLALRMLTRLAPDAPSDESGASTRCVWSQLTERGR